MDTSQRSYNKDSNLTQLSRPHEVTNGEIVGTTNFSGTSTANPATDAWGVESLWSANNLGYLGNDERYTTGGACA